MDLQTIKGTLGVILLCQVVVWCTALKLGEVGVCPTKIPIKAIPKEFQLKYSCPKDMRDCTKKEKTGLRRFKSKAQRCCIKKVPDYETRPTCCVGWEYVKEEDICKAKCRLGCQNGRCVAPNVCECDPPLILQNNNQCIQPVCDPICINAQCINNDTCECNTGLDKVNSTHCATPCGPGYINDPATLECVPQCDSPCLNGSCTAPNTCTCTNGYKLKDDNYTCVPHCTPGCRNSDCIFPDTCYCWNFYNKVNSSYCSPICDNCINGNCVAPFTCECHEGYLMKYDICTPYCNEGYKFASGNDPLCIPICERICVNSSCVSPNECACFDGYEKTEDNFTCNPSCKSCNHGDCVSPNNCICHEGFKKIADGCSPVCSDPCVNGFCSSPDVCSCIAGYTKNSTKPSVCFKPCQGLCDYGECTLDGECLCNSGYYLNNDTCMPYPPVECSSCESNCTVGLPCQCSDGRPCIFRMGTEAGVAAPTGLAGFELTWMLGAAILLLLITLVMVVIQRIWRKRKEYGAKNVEQCNTYGSVVYTVPDTLLQRKVSDDYDNDDKDSDCEDALDACDELEKETGERLLKSEHAATDDNAVA